MHPAVKKKGKQGPFSSFFSCLDGKPWHVSFSNAKKPARFLGKLEPFGCRWNQLEVVSSVFYVWHGAALPTSLNSICDGYSLSRTWPQSLYLSKMKNQNGHRVCWTSKGTQKDRFNANNTHTCKIFKVYRELSFDDFSCCRRVAAPDCKTKRSIRHMENSIYFILWQSTYPSFDNLINQNIAKNKTDTISNTHREV